MTTIYHAFDQAGLDAAYNNRNHTPDFQRYVDRWAAGSDAARATVPSVRDLNYGPSPRQTLDVFRPAAASPPGGRPALMYVHGGYWQGNHKDGYAFPAAQVTAAGALYIPVTYDLCPAVTMTELVAQLRRAVIWLHRNAAGIGLDPHRIVVAGHSAGGHLAATLAQTDWTAHGLPAAALAGAVPLSGLYDLEPIRLCYLNAACRMDAAEARALSPIHHVARRPIPLLLAVGGAELPELVRQTRDHGAALATAGVAPEAIVETQGGNHFSIVDSLFEPAGPLWPALTRMMGL